MSLYNGPPRPGARGGRGEFNWENVKNGPDAEFYLGHSVKALTGRWQKNRDVYWYTRDKAQQQSLQDEVQAVKQREQQLMMEALGLRPKSEQVVHKQMTAEELAVALQRNAQHQEADAAGAGPDKADVSAADRVKGLGFMPGAAAGVAGSGGPTHARLEGVGVPGNSTAHPQALGGGGGGGLPGPPPMAPGQAGPTLQAMMAMGVALSKQQIKELAKHDKSAAKQAKKEAKKARKAAKHAKKHSKKHKKRAADSGSDSSSSSAGSDSDAQPPSKLPRHTGPAAAPRSHQEGPGCSPSGNTVFVCLSPNIHSAIMSQPQVIVNPRGIPKAPFVENVEKFLKGESPEITLKKFQETISKYKFMEASLANRKKSLDSKIPEIRKTLKMVDFLMTRKDSEEPVETQYELNDTLYATANIKYTPDVYLWLGANVMVEYPIEEAKELLTKKVNQADLKYEQTEEDLEFLREQITTMEVNIARVYNYDVKLRKGIAAKKGSDTGSK